MTVNTLGLEFGIGGIHGRQVSNAGLLQEAQRLALESVEYRQPLVEEIFRHDSLIQWPDLLLVFRNPLQAVASQRQIHPAIGINCDHMPGAAQKKAYREKWDVAGAGHVITVDTNRRMDL